MKLSGRKVYGFTVILCILTATVFTLLFINPELLKVMGNYIVSCMVALFALMIGGNSADKYITSKHFIKEKWEEADENKDTELD